MYFPIRLQLVPSLYLSKIEPQLIQGLVLDTRGNLQECNPGGQVEIQHSNFSTLTLAPTLLSESYLDMGYRALLHSLQNHYTSQSGRKKIYHLVLPAWWHRYQVSAWVMWFTDMKEMWLRWKPLVVMWISSGQQHFSSIISLLLSCEESVSWWELKAQKYRSAKSNDLNFWILRKQSPLCSHEWKSSLQKAQGTTQLYPTVSAYRKIFSTKDIILLSAIWLLRYWRKTHTSSCKQRALINWYPNTKPQWDADTGQWFMPNAQVTNQRTEHILNHDCWQKSHRGPERQPRQTHYYK